MHKGPQHRIEVFVDRVEQLFNSMDPSPFHERDLDDNAEEFIVSWAQEFPRRDPVSLLVHVNELPARGDAQQLVETAVHNHFAYRANVAADKNPSLRLVPSSALGHLYEKLSRMRVEVRKRSG